MADRKETLSIPDTTGYYRTILYPDGTRTARPTVDARASKNRHIRIYRTHEGHPTISYHEPRASIRVVLAENETRIETGLQGKNWSYQVTATYDESHLLTRLDIPRIIVQTPHGKTNTGEKRQYIVQLQAESDLYGTRVHHAEYTVGLWRSQAQTPTHETLSVEPYPRALSVLALGRWDFDLLGDHLEIEVAPHEQAIHATVLLPAGMEMIPTIGMTIPDVLPVTLEERDLLTDPSLTLFLEKLPTLVAKPETHSSNR